ncbi:MAG: T9SS type A sorting domain-containing protein, partial [Paludibacteraceae bacterium]|nr:T9SS type A sorting domain-containing protein [Paludibacteraceae bacterium]
SKFVDMIDIERGGSIKGIENLNKDELRYTGAVDTITVYRTEERAKNIKQTDWVLVGGVVKKFKDSSDPSQGVRDIVSGDFFVENQTPHVYMQEFTEESGNFKPTIPFTDLKTVVPTYSAFGIYIPDQYGPYKLSSEIYYTYFDNQPDKVKDCYAPVFFDFTGRFANDDKLPEYPVSTAGKWIFVNNSYPANLDIYQLVDDYSGNELDAKIYDYSDREFRDPQDGDVVKPNNGFAIKVSSLPSGNKIQTEADHFVSGSTDYLKSADASTKLTLKVINGADATASTLYVKYGARSLDKAFSHNESTPEVYVPDGENRYSTFGIGDLSEIIPLSVRNKQPSGNLTFQFRLMDSNGFESVILEDRVLEKTYDLLGGEAPFFTIAPGDCAGRFYLNINYAEEEISTNVEEKTETKENNGIDIFANGDMLTVSASPASTLENIMVFDMSGRMYNIPVNGSNYVRCKLSVASGVYTVKAISDKGTETRKVIIK